MSAYASLPGSILPFFSFGGNSPKSDDESSDSQVSSHGHDQHHRQELVQRQPITPTSSISCPNLLSSGAPKTQDISYGSSSSLPDAAKLPQSSIEPTESIPATATSPTSSPATEIFIAINNARVDTVQLIQSLTTRGSNIARRTANFISSRNSDGTTSYKRFESNETSETEDAQTVHSKPSLCYDDSDDSDDEMSFYDYGNEDDYGMASSSAQDAATGYITTNEEHSLSSTTSQDEDAIQFELFINFHGREYRAFRAFSTFVQLRRDLLRDRSVPSSVSIPELPSLEDNNVTYSSGFHALARSGFAMLQATAKMYCPVMELWLRNVVEVVPSSPILNRFLWEPLASSTAGCWNDINENGGGGDGLGKPPQIPRSKARSSGSSGLKFMRSKSYNTSLSSITELLDES